MKLVNPFSLAAVSAASVLSSAAVCVSLALAPAMTHAAATVGQAAPAFSLKDTAGRSHSLSDFKGRFVVLEWHNPGCPFVQKHYTGNMQALQSRYATRDVVWLTVNSTEPAHSDYRKPAELAAWMKSKNAAPTAYLMDESGTTGLAYGAKTTPHMYVIDPAGKLVFAGGIDDKRTANPADIKDARNHVAAALDEAQAGRPVSVPTATPYGCSVKYKG